MEDLQCKVCTTHEVYEGMVAIGVDKEEAFHIAVGSLLVSVIEQSVEDGYDAGYEVGYKDASNDIEEIVSAYSRSVQEA